MTGPQFRFRWSPIDGPELRCAHCGDWWSVGDDAGEHWVIGKWAECRSCHRERARLREALRRRDPDYRARELEKTRRYRKFVRENAPDYLVTYDRERKARHRAWLRAYRADKRAAA